MRLPCSFPVKCDEDELFLICSLLRHVPSLLCYFCSLGGDESEDLLMLLIIKQHRAFDAVVQCCF